MSNFVGQFFKFSYRIYRPKILEVNMSRPIRKHSKTGYMHVMIRGLTRQIIFNEDQDAKFMLRHLFKLASEYNIIIVCYCLMINHAHFLLIDKDNNISNFMRILCGKYSQYYNNKYDRCGSLFQRPFKSKPIENDAYLLSAYHYILNNTAKDGICPPQEYEWNSYKLAGKPSGAFDDSIVIDMIGGINNLDFYLQSEDDDYSFDSNTDYVKITNRSAIKEILEHYHIKTTTTIRAFSKEKRDEAVRWLQYKGFSIRQIERLTGISRGEIQNIR